MRPWASVRTPSSSVMERPPLQVTMLVPLPDEEEAEGAGAELARAELAGAELAGAAEVGATG